MEALSDRVARRVIAVTLMVAVIATFSVSVGPAEPARGPRPAPGYLATTTTLPIEGNLLADLRAYADNAGRAPAVLPSVVARATRQATPETEPATAAPPPAGNPAPVAVANPPVPETGAAASAATTTTTTNTNTNTNTTTTTTTTTTTISPTTTTTTPPPPPASTSGNALRLWDTAWQIAAKANDSSMQTYVDRIASARGSGGQSITGFWFSVVNLTSDLNTANGFGHTFGSFAEPNSDYLADIERLISLASGRGLKVGIVVAWDGPNQFSVESGKLNANNGYQYGYSLASQLTRSDFGARSAIDSWVMGGDSTNDCCGGEHGSVWSEVVRGLEDAQADNGFSKRKVLLHTAPGQHMNYLGDGWLDGHAPQTGHCTNRAKAVEWMQDLANTGATIWGNGEMRYEDIAWPCNGNAPITPQQVLDDVIAMKNLGVMSNFVYGFDPRWNSSTPGSVGLSSSGVSPGLQMILDEPGLIRGR